MSGVDARPADLITSPGRSPALASRARRGRLGDRAVRRGDDALGDAAGQAERVAGGQYHVAGLRLVGVTERGRLQPGVEDPWNYAAGRIRVI